jgi:hypothetical protein
VNSGTTEASRRRRDPRQGAGGFASEHLPCTIAPAAHRTNVAGRPKRVERHSAQTAETGVSSPQRKNGRAEALPFLLTTTSSSPAGPGEDEDQLIFNALGALKLPARLMQTSPLYLPGTLSPVLSEVTVPENFSSDGSDPE